MLKTRKAQTRLEWCIANKEKTLVLKKQSEQVNLGTPNKTGVQTYVFLSLDEAAKKAEEMGGIVVTKQEAEEIKIKGEKRREDAAREVLREAQRRYRGV